MKTTKTFLRDADSIDLTIKDVARLLIGETIRNGKISIRVTKISAIRFFIGGILSLIRFFVLRGDVKFESGRFVVGDRIPGEEERYSEDIGGGWKRVVINGRFPILVSPVDGHGYRRYVYE